MSKVAICIPCYNNTEKLKRLLDSIVIQDFKDYIVIITDDSDNYIIEELIAEYPLINIQYYKNNIRLGAASNTNRALKYAQNLSVDYIKVMYHDDFFSLSSSLDKMVKALEMNEKAFLAFSSTYVTGRNINYERMISREQIELLNKDCFNLLYANIIGAPSAVLVRKNNLLLDEQLKWFVDVDWYIRIINTYSNPVFISESLVTIGLSDTQVTCECVYNPMLILSEIIYLYNKYSNLHCESYTNLIIRQAEKVVSSYRIWQISRKIHNVYIYGAGKKGTDCAEFLKQNDISFNAFVVSNGKRIRDSLYGHPIIELDEYLEIVKNEKCIIILALNELMKAEVSRELKKRKVEFIDWK